VSAEDDSPPLTVFDCQLFLQAALRATGPAAACFDLVEGRQIRLVVSETVLAEVRDVLSQPRLLRKYPQLASPRVAQFLARIVEQAEFLDPVPKAFSYPRDPKDQPYLDLAIHSGAHFLVSRDKDLLDLRDADSEPGQELRRQNSVVAILDPVELLRLYPPASEEAP